MFGLDAHKGHYRVPAEIGVILCRVGPYPVDSLARILIEVVGLVAQVRGSKVLVCTVVIVDAEIGTYHKILYRLDRQVCVAEHAPVLMLVGALLIYLTYQVGSIVESESHLVVIVALGVIDRAGRVHLDCVLLDTAGSVVLPPPVDGDITACAQTVVQEPVVRAESGVGLLEIRALDDAVMVEPAQRER